jgi:hypothetical protein
MEGEEQIGRDLDEVFRVAEFTLWKKGKIYGFISPGRTYPLVKWFWLLEQILGHRVGTVGGASAFRNPSSLVLCIYTTTIV